MSDVRNLPQSIKQRKQVEHYVQYKEPENNLTIDELNVFNATAICLRIAVYKHNKANLYSFKWFSCDVITRKH